MDIDQGSLKFSRVNNTTWTMSGGNLNLNGGTLDMGTSASPIPSSVKAVLMLSSGSTAGEFGLIANAGSKFYVYGSTKMISTTTITTEDLETNESTFTLHVDPISLDWEVGDTVTIGPGNAGIWGTSTTEEKVITGFPESFISQRPSTLQ